MKKVLHILWCQLLRYMYVLLFSISLLIEYVCVSDD